MDCERVKDLLELEQEGKLSAAERSQTAAHAESCDGCREHRDALAQTASALAAVRLEPFPEHRSRKIMALVRELPPPRRSFWTRLAELLAPAPSWGYAAVPAMAVLLLVFWPRAPHGATPGTSPGVTTPTVQVALAPLGTVETEEASVTVAGKTVTASRAEFRAGDEIAVPRASATLRFNDGTRIQLQNPARARAGERSLDLLSGKVLAAVSKTGKGFQLRTCTFAVKVMGTRFSVDHESCKVELLEGKVQTVENAATLDLSPGQAFVHEQAQPSRRSLSEAERRELLGAFLRFEGAPRLAVALGTTEDAVRAMARPPRAASDTTAAPQPPASVRPPATPTAVPSAPAAGTGPKPAFNPVQGLGK